jgi:hypothetical protein
MDLIVCWLIAPTALVAIAVGLSLLVEQLADLAVPWTIRPALGLAAAMVIAQVATVADATAELAVPAIVVLAVLGVLLGTGLVTTRPSGWAIGAGLIVYLVFAAPFLAHGEPTWAGYIKLDDTGTFMGVIDHTFEAGRGVGHLAPSTYEAMLSDLGGSYPIDLGGSYPIGSLVPAAVMAKLSGQDPAWVIQSSMAVAAFAMSLLIFELVRDLVRGRATAAAIAVVGSLSSILLGYYLWGGTKEVVAAALLPLGPALGAYAMRLGWPRQVWVPLGVTSAAFLAELGPGAAVWLAPTLIPLAVLVIRTHGRSVAIRIAAATFGLTVVLALPSLIAPNGVLNPLAETHYRAGLENLTGPLNPLHIAGIWPSLDFRSDPSLKPAVLALAVLCLVLAAAAVLATAREGSGVGIPFASFAGGGALGAIAVMLAGSPWIAGKAMATVSPALLAAAALAIALIWQRTDFRIEAATLAVVVGGAVVWSAFLAYRGVWFAPRDHYTELETIGQRFAGHGPALSTEVSSYGPRHFLRKLDPEGATDLRRRQVLLTGGRQSEAHSYVDLDDIQTDQLDPYETIVLRRGPATSRPPASFELSYSGKHYEVWERGGSVPGSLVEHLPLGNQIDAGGTPDCADVGSLAQAAGPNGTLVAARASTPITVDFATANKPSKWDLPTPISVFPDTSGVLTTSARVPSEGEYELWLGGSVFGRAELRVDGSEVGSERAELNNDGGYEPLGEVQLSAGQHQIELGYDRGVIDPGGGTTSVIGPLELDAAGSGDLGTVKLPPTEYRRLCGGRWDWIEAYS